MTVKGFNEGLRDICAGRCADIGDPPCWKLPELCEPCEEITPCAVCLVELEMCEDDD